MFNTNLFGAELGHEPWCSVVIVSSRFDRILGRRAKVPNRGYGAKSKLCHGLWQVTLGLAHALTYPCSRYRRFHTHRPYISRPIVSYSFQILFG